MSRVVLIPFTNEENLFSPSERWSNDQKLSEAMKKASAAGAILIKLGSKLVDTEGLQCFDTILQRISTLMPSQTPQRLFTSYSVLLLATLKV